MRPGPFRPGPHLLAGRLARPSSFTDRRTHAAVEFARAGCGDCADRNRAVCACRGAVDRPRRPRRRGLPRHGDPAGHQPVHGGIRRHGNAHGLHGGPLSWQWDGWRQVRQRHRPPDDIPGQHPRRGHRGDRSPDRRLGGHCAGARGRGEQRPSRRAGPRRRSVGRAAAGSAGMPLRRDHRRKLWHRRRRQ